MKVSDGRNDYVLHLYSTSNDFPLSSLLDSLVLSLLYLILATMLPVEI